MCVVSAIQFDSSKYPQIHNTLKLQNLNLIRNLVPNKQCLFAVFDEDFVFEVRPTTLGRRTLEVILYDFDAYSRHHSIGGVKLPLAHVDLSEKVTLWKGLGPCSEQDAKVISNSVNV
jgi:hypothetical protein